MSPSGNPSETTFDPEAFLRKQTEGRSGKRVEEIRKKISALEKELEDILAAEATIRVVVEGEGGGTWFINVKGAEATVAPDPSGEPLLTIHQVIDDFRRAARMGGGLGIGGADRPLTRSRIARMRPVRGTLELRVTDIPDEPDLPVVVHFGGGERAPEPQAVIAIKGEAALRIRKGELNPQMAFMQGMIRITGDSALAMQVGMATM